MMKKILIVAIVFFCINGLFAQGFSGSIEFKYATQKDTSINVFMVKNKQVRLDQYGKKGNVEGSFLFDLGASEVKFLNPKRKLWGKQKSETPQVIRGQCIVIKGNVPKTVANVKCTEYAVKNSEENTVITYWIAEGGKYNYFAPMMKLRNGKDKQSTYYSQIKGLSEGAMPLLSEEKQLTDGKLVTRLEATKITNTPPEDSNFMIPEGYNKFDQ